MDNTTRTILRLDALFDSSFGVLMLLAPWIGGVYDLLDLPNPQPEVFTQIGGGLLLVCGYLLWASAVDDHLARAVARAIGAINAVAIPLLVGWIISGDLGTGTLGNVILGAACVILAVFAWVELRYGLSRAEPEA
jgi:small-conductance mechanosensitive channel